MPEAFSSKNEDPFPLSLRSAQQPCWFLSVSYCGLHLGKI